jgi:HIV-1 Vpr-binding protein
MFRTVFDIRNSDDGLSAQCLSFCDGGSSIAVGTSEGGIAIFDVEEDTLADKLKEQHILFEDNAVIHLAVSSHGRWIGASSDSSIQMYRRDRLPNVMYRADDSYTCRFSHCEELTVLTGHDHGKCRVVDLATGITLNEYTARDGPDRGNYRAVAQFDATDSMILHDAVLWDVRADPQRGPAAHFDRTSDFFVGAFHPSNRMVILDDAVWDLRNLQMLLSCPHFKGSEVLHGASGGTLYAFRESSPNPSVVNMVDSQTFDLLACHELRPALRSFAIDYNERYFGGLQDHDSESLVKVFAIGKDAESGDTAVEPEDRLDDDFIGEDDDDGDDEDSSEGSEDDQSDEEDDSDSSVDSSEFFDGEGVSVPEGNRSGGHSPSGDGVASEMST